MLLQVGEYQAGNDPVADLAIERVAEIRAFLNQKTSDLMPYEDILGQLAEVVR
jgi:type III secretion protein N (ATPase)